MTVSAKDPRRVIIDYIVATVLTLPLIGLLTYLTNWLSLKFATAPHESYERYRQLFIASSDVYFLALILAAIIQAIALVRVLRTDSRGSAKIRAAKLAIGFMSVVMIGAIGIYINLILHMPS